ncbi:Integrin alpha-PS1 [Orchesella cincta]|uniref:Integrin alpha-PS1 n=1 Tax=Orchesella cincta TaxID=48709 RepID=A0A1D2N476_ORCCI|nr:Integrin alpha-PS1 [Orchesella cincta]
MIFVSFVDYRILVGAPLGQNLQPQTNRSGALYKCPISSYEGDCEQVITDGKRVMEQNELSPPLDDELKDGQWMGVNVRSQGPGRKVMVCAHRYVNQGKDFRWGLGLCHFLTQYLEYDQTLEPCRNKVRRALEDYGFCQAGTSADILEDDTALMGAPGAYTCRGMVFGISVSDDYLNKDRNHYHTPLLENSPIDKYSYLGMSVSGGRFFGDHYSYVAGAPKAALGSGQVFFFTKGGDQGSLQVEGFLTGEGFAFSYGYELATLDINGDNKTDLVVGAPFYMDSKQAGGAAYVYINDDGFRPDHPYVRLTGTRESRFGLALSSAGDLNRDGFDDLAVGAPYSFEGTGAVYIYLGSKDGIIREPSQVIEGREYYPDMLTFGYSLSGGADLDGNNYPDLLVGAYDSDAVVLLRARPIIDVVTNVYGNLSNIDPNGHGCSEFPTSNQTCFSFIACFEITGITQVRASSLRVEYRIEAETFVEGKKFSRVAFYNGRRDRPQLVNQTVTIRRSGAASNKYCSNETVFLKEGTKDIQSPIAFKLTYTLIQREPVYIPNAATLPNIQNYPILNQQEASKVFLANFEKDCGENDHCESDLYVNAVPELEETDDSGHYLLVLGRDTVFVLNISLANFGEPAYEAALYVSHPKSMSYIGQDAELQKKGLGCTPFNASLVSCPLGNPYKRHADFRYLRLRFDAGNLKDIETKLEFEVWANSTSIDDDEQNNHKTVTATVIKMAELSIAGTGEPEKLFYVYGGNVIGESAIKSLAEIGPRVTHQYEVWNAGPWKASYFNVDIWWPHQVENGKSQGKWLLYPEGPPVLDGDGQCFLPNDVTDILHLRTKRETETIVASQKERGPDGKFKTYVEMNCVRGSAKCFRIECVIRNLLPRESAVIKIHSRLWNATLVEDYPTVDEVRIRSKAQIRISDEIRQDPGNDVAQALTTCFPDLKLKVELEGIAWWIYAVSILVGIIVLALIVYCLYKTGFFKRRRPEPTHTARVSRS